MRFVIFDCISNRFLGSHSEHKETKFMVSLSTVAYLPSTKESSIRQASASGASIVNPESLKNTKLYRV